VIQLLHGYQGKEPKASGAWLLKRVLLSEVLARVDTTESSLSAIEKRVCTGPEMSDVDQQIECPRREAGGRRRRRVGAGRVAV
jgi:hypothetical protein